MNKPNFIQHGTGRQALLAAALCAAWVVRSHGFEISEAALARLSAPAREALAKASLAPLGQVPVPPGNPLSKEKVELGRLLYFDKRLSADTTVSCASCHDPKTGWAEAEPTSTGIRNQLGPRNAPSVLDSAYYHALFWDGRAQTLEEQALGPIQNPKEMGNDLPKMVAALSQVKGYAPYFKAAFGEAQVTSERVAQAIAAFERTVVSGPSPFDDFLQGSVSALSGRQVQGLELFLTKGKCTTCHRGPFLTTGQYAVSNLPGDEGRAQVTKNAADKAKFRIPTLRNVGLTGPYFHDGSVASLEDAVFVRANGFKPSAGAASAAELKLTQEEVRDVAAFLKSLNGKLPEIAVPTQFPE
jgi:cytochrome c peroxidase